MTPAHDPHRVRCTKAHRLCEVARTSTANYCNTPFHTSGPTTFHCWRPHGHEGPHICCAYGSHNIEANPKYAAGLAPELIYVEPS